MGILSDLVHKAMVSHMVKETLYGHLNEEDLINIEDYLRQSNILNSVDSWNGMFIDYEYPHVERLWIQYKKPIKNQNIRIHLHKIYPCKPQQAFFHPHPWESVMKILSGKYRMQIGSGYTKKAPDIATTLILPEGSVYEMDNPLCWHSVCPIETPVYSVMITGNPWNKTKSNVNNRELTLIEKEVLLNDFKKIYKGKL